jgi:hypothetical protein
MKEKEKLNVNVLVTANNQYMNHYLKKNLGEYIMSGIVSIYNDAVETQNKLESYEYKKQFQLFLKAIPNWNQTILVNETKRIITGMPYFQKLVSAIFLSEVKILASIRLGGEDKNIEIKVPPSDILIHKIYINVAKVIYSSRDLLDLFSDINTNKLSYSTIKKVIEDIIEETILELVPVQYLLEEYLTAVIPDVSREGQDDEENEEDEENGEDGEDDGLGNGFGSDAVGEQLSDEFGNSGDSSGFDDYDNITSADPDAPTIKIGDSDPSTDPSADPFANTSTDNFSDPSVDNFSNTSSDPSAVISEDDNIINQLMEDPVTKSSEQSLLEDSNNPFTSLLGETNDTTDETVNTDNLVIDDPDGSGGFGEPSGSSDANGSSDSKSFFDFGSFGSSDSAGSSDSVDNVDNNDFGSSDDSANSFGTSSSKSNMDADLFTLPSSDKSFF